MPIEIERKFLVKNDAYKNNAVKKLYRQGYLSTDKTRTVRIRILDESAMLTIKGPSIGSARPEYEYPIPLEDAESLLALCKKPLIEKYRYRTTFENRIWEVDEFLGDNEGLIVAEIELEHEDQPFIKPEWVGREVTSDPRYFNSNLTHHPFKEWKETC
jgi:adenylate cyclase